MGARGFRSATCSGGGDTGLDSHPARTATGVGERRYYRYEVALSTLDLV